eukprot:470248_1
MYRMNSMLTNTLKKRKLRNCMLWDRTYLNDKNPCNIYLYIKQKNNSSTRPISIKPYQYLSKLSEHNIDPQSLHIPLICPTFEDPTQTQTATILWNIMEAHRACEKAKSSSVSKSRNSPVNNDINVNKCINNKLDWIMNALAGSNDSKHEQQLQEENQLLKLQLLQKNKENVSKDTQIDALQQTLWNAQQTIKEKTQENVQLKRNKTKVIKNRYYWKWTATERYNKMKWVGLTYSG